MNDEITQIQLDDKAVERELNAILMIALAEMREILEQGSPRDKTKLLSSIMGTAMRSLNQGESAQMAIMRQLLAEQKTELRAELLGG